MVTSQTQKVGLICWPIGHSLSPVMHNAAFEALGMDWVYLPLAASPDALPAALAGLSALSFVGCNISVPHKTKVIPFLDHMDESSRQMQAVNTIKVIDGRLVGSNTDPEGFTRHLVNNGVDPIGMKIVFIGAGGAARAAVFGLSSFKVKEITILDIVESQGLSLISDLNHLFPDSKLDYKPISQDSFDQVRDYDLVVNASPIGMAPNIDKSPWPDNIELPSKAIVYDIVYNPIETKLLSRAKKEGHQTLNGLGMLVNQGAASFETWTGIQPPIDLMMEVCEKNLKLTRK